MTSNDNPIAELDACYDEVSHLLDQIPSVSDESKRRRYFQTIPALMTRQFGTSGVNVFHLAAARRNREVLEAFDLEEKLFSSEGDKGITNRNKASLCR